MKRGRINRMRIPLSELTQDERKLIEDMKGKFIVIIVNEPCLTCGHKKRLQHVERTDGKQEIIRECLYCLVNIHTSANRSGP